MSAMRALDPRIFGIFILASSAVFLGVKRWATDSFVKGSPDRGGVLWLVHLFNLLFFLVVNPGVAALLVARKYEAVDPTVVARDRGAVALFAGLGGLAFSLAGYFLMCWALTAMKGHFQVLGKAPRPTDQLLLSGPYRLVRHPMYASLLYLSLGLSLMTRSVAIFGLFLVYAALVIRLVPLEEAKLLRAYGGPYASFQGRVKKLIPLVY
jgi:protein-S-isoprenylcysteine O-methyltransferase Ste14